MCFLKDMVLQKQPHMRLLLQYALFGQLLLIEFLNLGNHVLNFLVYLQKIGVQDTFFSFYRRKFIELGKWVFGVILFLLAYFFHIEVGLAEEFTGLELFCLLNVHTVTTSCFGLDKISCSLTAYPSSQLAYQQSWNQEQVNPCFH